MKLTPQQIKIIDGLLPIGWLQEPYNGDSSRAVIVISTPSHEHVTICFEQRWWNLGHGISRLFMGPGYSSQDKRYTGRTWCKEMVADAIAALLNVRGQNDPSRD